MNARYPVVPEYITVHLGAPDNKSAENVSVGFADYIKNVASSEIYPTWPEAALRANIYAQISFALNRIYTEHYRSRGYDFDITNSTAYDQAFVRDRDIFDNISIIVDEIFNDYIVREGYIEPLFAVYCNGTTVTCDGLSQWGSVSLANDGLGAYDILTRYYGENIGLVENAPVQALEPSPPNILLSEGSAGNDVKFIQVRLNRISTNYPSIPKIPKVDGVFGVETENAVREFQRIFTLNRTGTVDKSTWYSIQRVYDAVKRLSELDSEGIRDDEISNQFKDLLSEGDSGEDIKTVQYYLRFISEFNPAVPTPLSMRSTLQNLPFPSVQAPSVAEKCGAHPSFPCRIRRPDLSSARPCVYMIPRGAFSEAPSPVFFYCCPSSPSPSDNTSPAY